MQVDLITNMVWIVLLLVSVGVLAFAGTHSLVQVKKFVLEAVPYFRRLFDPNSILLAFLATRGINVPQAKADEAAELVADIMEKWAKSTTPDPE